LYSAAPVNTDLTAVGVVLAATGIVFIVEPLLALAAPAVYDAINRARRRRRWLMVVPAGLIVGAWGVVCVVVGAPLHHPARWCLVVLGALCIAKGVATLCFSRRLAGLSERTHARASARRVRGVVGLLLGASLVAWGVVLTTAA